MKGLTFRNKKVGLITLVMVLAMTGLTVQMVRVFAGNNKTVSGSGESPGGVVLTVSAVGHENGNVTGLAKFHNRETNSGLSIDVTAISINGNTAVVTGEVIKRTGTYATNCVGTHAKFAVQDNGEGGDAPVDLFTRETCYTGLTENVAVKPFGSEMGNFQVRDSQPD